VPESVDRQEIIATQFTECIRQLSSFKSSKTYAIA